MEKIAQQEGVFNTPVTDEETIERAADGLAQTSGSIALSSEVVSEASATRYGYREDSPPEIIDLLHNAQAGDREAFAELYRLHINRITAYVGARMRNERRDAIPDVVQDAFCEAFANLPSAHHDVTGWLLAHAAKAYIRYARSARSQDRAFKGTREVARREFVYGHDWQPNGNGMTAIGHVMLVHGLARLTPAQRTTIQHRYLEGQTQATTAQLLDRTVSTVKSNEYRALARLRAQFSDA